MKPRKWQVHRLVNRKSGQWNQNSLMLVRFPGEAWEGLGRPGLRSPMHGPEFRPATHSLGDLK